MPANKIKLEICGASYVIATTDTEEYVLSLAEKLDALGLRAEGRQFFLQLSK